MGRPRKEVPAPAAAESALGDVEVASVKHAAPDSVEALKRQIADLSAQLSLQRSESEQKALALAEAQGGFMQREIREVPTGKFKKLKRCAGYEVVSYKDDGRPNLKPKWEDEDVPTFFYKIDMPPVGGLDSKINGESFEHGVVYVFDQYQLRTVKEMMWRLWKHEGDIRGSNENAYRQQQNVRI